MGFRDIFDETRRKIGGAIGNQVDNFRVGMQPIKRTAQNPYYKHLVKETFKGIPRAAQQTFSREGLGSAAGVREAGKGILRTAVTGLDTARKLQPGYYVQPQRAKIQQNQFRDNMLNRLAPRGNEVQRALNRGFEFSSQLASYGPIEGATLKVASKVLPRLAASKGGQFAIRRGADVLSGQMLATPEEVKNMGGGVKGRLKIAGMDIVGGTAMEGAGRIAKPIAKVTGQKINLAKGASKMGKELPSRVKVGENAFSYNRGGRTLEVPNEVAEFYIKNGKMPTKNDILPKNYKYKGTTELRFQDGKFHGWDSDNDLFKAKIAQEAPSIGLSTKDISGKPDALSNEARSLTQIDAQAKMQRAPLKLDTPEMSRLLEENPDKYWQIKRAEQAKETARIQSSAGIKPKIEVKAEKTAGRNIYRVYKNGEPIDFYFREKGGLSKEEILAKHKSQPLSPQSTPSALSNEARKFGKFSKIDTKSVTESPFISPNSGYVGDFANKKSASGLSYFSQEKVNELNFHLKQAGHKGVSSKDFKGIYSLDKVLQDDALFNKYPTLREYNVVFADFHTPKKRGMRVGNTIYVNANLYEKNPELLNSTIVHEIEHAKQGIKGIKAPDDEIIRGAKEQYQYKYSTDNEIAARKRQDEYMAQVSQPLSPQSTQGASKAKSLVAEDTKSIIDGAEVKERSFGKRVKLSENTPKEVKELVGGSYVVKSNKKLTADAKNLIRTNIDVADQMAMNPRNANDIEVGNQLIVHYQNQGNFQKAADIANAMNKSLTEGGQFVQAASLYDKTTPGGIQRFAQAEVEKFNKANPNKKIKIDDKTMESLFKRAEKIQKMAEGRDRSIAIGELFNEVADIIPTSNWKKAITLWKAGLLTSFRTHERNLVGNTLNVGGEIAKDPIAAVMDALMSTRTGSRTKTFTLSGMGKGTVKGASSAKDYLYKGFDPEKTIEKFDVKRINWGKSKLGKVAQAYTEGVFRTLGAADKPFYHSALTRSLYDQAGAKAINAGKRGNKQFIENIVTNPTDDMLKIATRDAEIAVFQQSTTAGNMLSSLKKKLKDKGEFAEAAGEFFLPFTQVPSGVGSQLISYSPAGLTQGVLNTARTMITKDAGLQRQAAEQMGRGIVGTGIMALGYELYRSGNMTGKYPADAKEREQWKLEGKQENSVKIGGKWRKLSAIGPQASILVTGAQLAESVEEGDASALSVASSAGSEFLDQPFVQGMSVPLDVLKDPERNVKKFSNQASASLIPNIVKDVSRGLDPYKREAETAGESIKKSIPLMRNDLTPMRDAYGEPLPEEGGVIKNMFDLFNSLTPKGDDTTKELRRLLDAGEGATPSRLQNNQTIAGEKLKLKNAELDEIEKIAGPMTKQGFDQMIKTPEYQEMSDEDKKKALQKITEDARAVAKLQAAESKNLVDVDTLIEKSKKLTKDQKELLSGGTFDSVKRDYDLDKQIDFLDGDYGKLAFLKKKKDFSTWQTEAEGLMKMYEEKYTNAETEADKMKYELKIIKLAEEMQKYAGYGGFTKGKAGKKFGGITLPTTTAKIPIRQAKAPAFKNVSKTPRIAIKTTSPKTISKSTLANMR